MSLWHITQSGNTQNNNVPGEGTYAEKGYIYAAITGTVDIKEIVEEDVKYNQISILSSIKNKSAQLKIGSIIIGRVRQEPDFRALPLPPRKAERANQSCCLRILKITKHSLTFHFSLFRSLTYQLSDLSLYC